MTHSTDERDRLAKARCDNPDDCGRNASCCVLCRDFKDGFDAGHASGVKECEERINAMEDALKETKEIFRIHLDTMGEINAHLGYPFSQPLINATKILKSLGAAKERT